MSPSSQPAAFPVLAGPTASGKTQFALELCEKLGLEIINADSLLVYRGFDIGTAKPGMEERSRVPHHLIDIRDPLEAFTAADFVRQVHALHASLTQVGRRALIVGGTHFYLKALCQGLWDAPPTHPEFRSALDGVETQELHARLGQKDPAHASKIGPADRYRIIRALEIIEFSGRKPSDLEAEAEARSPDPRFPLLRIDRTSEELEARIRLRTGQMLEQGLIEETRTLMKAHPGARALGSVGYRQVVDHIEQRAPAGRKLRPGLAGLEDEIRLATRQLVKSQRTFLGGLSFAEGFILEQDRLKLAARIEALL
jgi:tRNA dimethylallyltransferase